MHPNVATDADNEFSDSILDDEVAVTKPAEQGPDGRDMGKTRQRLDMVSCRFLGPRQIDHRASPLCSNLHNRNITQLFMLHKQYLLLLPQNSNHAPVPLRRRRYEVKTELVRGALRLWRLPNH
jgi:hypothetical protein